MSDPAGGNCSSLCTMDHCSSPVSGEHIKLTIMEDSDALSRAAACRIAERITAKALAGEKHFHQQQAGGVPEGYTCKAENMAVDIPCTLMLLPVFLLATPYSATQCYGSAISRRREMRAWTGNRVFPHSGVQVAGPLAQRRGASFQGHHHLQPGGAPLLESRDAPSMQHVYLSHRWPLSLPFQCP